MPKNYSIRNVTTPLPRKAGDKTGANGVRPASSSNDVAVPKKSNLGKDGRRASDVRAEFARAEAEDDDGYDPYSDRPPTPEAAFQEDPWR